MRLQTPPFWAFFSQYVSVWYHIFFGDWFVLLLECAHTVMLVSDTLKQKHEPNNWIKLGESASVCICSVFWHRGWSIVKKQNHSNLDSNSVKRWYCRFQIPNVKGNVTNMSQCCVKLVLGHNSVFGVQRRMWYRTKQNSASVPVYVAVRPCWAKQWCYHCNQICAIPIAVQR